MSEKGNPAKQNPHKILHGNQAQIDPHAQITSAFITQALSNVQEIKNETPLIAEADVERARAWNMEHTL